MLSLALASCVSAYSYSLPSGQALVYFPCATAQEFMVFLDVQILIVRKHSQEMGKHLKQGARAAVGGVAGATMSRVDLQ